jgi:hypothetical protein
LGGHNVLKMVVEREPGILAYAFWKSVHGTEKLLDIFVSAFQSRILNFIGP